jgi:hypothetical protein
VTQSDPRRRPARGRSSPVSVTRRAKGQASAGRRAVALAALALAGVLAACSAASPGSSSAPGTTDAGNSETPRADPGNPVTAGSQQAPAWLLTRAALSWLVRDQAVRDMLRGWQVYELLQPGQKPLAAVGAHLVVGFTSATALEDAVTGGQLPAATYGVLYDPEAWSFTPAAEQQDPVSAAARAAAIAHARGLRFIVTPALNLTTVLGPGGPQPRWRQFLGLDLVGRLAAVADVIELQAQSLERDPGAYAAFVRAATAQATSANSRISVLAGLSTNPPGTPVDSRNLTDAIEATRSVVDGYWLNIPGQGPRCPTCGLPRPDIALQTLQAYAG